MHHNRTFYCPHCFARGRAKDGDHFVLIDNKGRYEVHTVEFAERMNRGFTPHVIEMKKSADGNVHFDYTCAMHDCGHFIQWNRDKEHWMVTVFQTKIQKGVMTVKDWNALIGFIDDGFQLEG